jgi:hypothetical protein
VAPDRRRKEVLVATLALLTLALLLTGPAVAQPRTPTGALLYDVLPYQPTDMQIRAYAALERRGDRGAIPALVELLRFDLTVPAEVPVGVLEALSGQRFGPAWPRWVEWLQKQTDITPPPEFVAWKGRLLSLIDPAFLEWFTPGIPARIRMEEVVWGGVAKDGIPALMSPATLPASRATYLTDDEPVFGVTLNGQSRGTPTASWTGTRWRTTSSAEWRSPSPTERSAGRGPSSRRRLTGSGTGSAPPASCSARTSSCTTTARTASGIT